MINSVRKIIFIGVLIATLPSFAHRDGCKEIAQECVCKNTAINGFCFPGSNSRYQGELYCNCQADVYSPYELAREWIKNFVMTHPLRKSLILSKYQDIAPLIYKLSSSLQNEIFMGTLGRKLPSQPDAYQPLISYMEQHPIAGEFFELRDNCQSIGQSCICKNNHLQGICSMNYPKEGKSFTTNSLYCHCD